MKLLEHLKFQISTQGRHFREPLDPL